MKMDWYKKRKHQKINIRVHESVVLSEKLEEIEEQAFQNSKILSKVNFSDSLITIGDNAFYIVQNWKV